MAQACTTVTCWSESQFGDLSTRCLWQPPLSPASVHTSLLHQPARTPKCQTLKHQSRPGLLSLFLLNSSTADGEIRVLQKGCFMYSHSFSSEDAKSQTFVLG